MRLIALKSKALNPPSTIGEHLRARRLELELTQQAAADHLGFSVGTVLNWERHRTQVPVQAVPAVIAFLGYDPFPSPRTLSERMAAKRRSMGWSIKEAAEALGVDEGTWGAWEREAVKPWTRYEQLLLRFLDPSGPDAG